MEGIEQHVGPVTADVGINCQLRSVSKYGHVQLTVAVRLKITDVCTSHHKFRVCVVVDICSLGTFEFASNQHVVLLHLQFCRRVDSCPLQCVGNLVVAVCKSHVSTQSCHRIFVESLMQCQSHAVIHIEQLIAVERAVVGQEAVRIKILPVVVGNHPASVVPDFRLMEDAGHWNEIFFCGDRVNFFHTCESQMISVVECENVVVLSRKSAVQSCGNVVMAEAP